MAHEVNDDIFFVPSDDDPSSETLNLQFMNPHPHDTAVSSMGDNQDGSGGDGPLDEACSHLSAHPWHDDGPTSPGNPTMADVLFNRPTRKRNREDVPRSNDTATGLSPSPPPPPLVQNAAWYAGGSPEAMPVGRPDLTPLTLDNLRSMTCSDVRETLESFFLTKEAKEHRFAAAKAEILLPLEDGTSSSSIAPAAKRPPCTPEEWRVRDRYVRLINVGNWSGDPAQDVLLPSALVPHSSYQHLQGTPPPPGETGAMKSEGSAPSLPIRSRTLRDHQVAGIRFLWNVLVEGPVGRVPAVGCILAHTMGLGKTAQVVLFSHLFAAAYTAPLLSGPGGTTRRLPRICIVVPKSTVPGWLKELASWSTSFPSAKRLQALTLEDAARPDERVRVFQQWRRDGGIFLIGYEALTRLLQLVEVSGVPYDETTGGRATVAGNPFRETVRRVLRQNGRVDEGTGPSGRGPYDPYTELVVCDEAHRLKNLNLQVVAALRKLHPLRRMLLTGTPLQNHLSEYWSMVDFAMPMYFDQRRFKEYFVTPIESSVNSKATKFEVDIARKKTFTLINEVRHFVLRVDSTPLKKELPPLHEYVVVLPLTDLQRSLYLRFLAAVRSDTSERFHFLPAVSLAGKIACHPALVFAMKNRHPTPSQQTAPRSSVGAARGGARRGSTPSTLEVEPVNILSDDAEALSKLSFSRLYRSTAYDTLYDAPREYTARLDDSVKLRVAVEIIAQAVELGEKTLLFTLSTTLLDYFETLLVSENVSRARPIRHCRLDGSHTSRQRAALITDFHAKDGADVFLLSTKAGGVGITITAATRVILVDTSFNPADDQQAIGRAYRYGQERPVYVYRLLCQHTLEYSIFEQKLAKEWLFRTVVEDTAVKRDGLSGMRLRELFSLLGQSERALRNPPAPTARQSHVTKVLVEEDSILRAIQPYMVGAKRYAMCLPIDPDTEYGDAERDFYTKYRRDRVFAREQGATEAAWDDILAKRKQREEQATQLRVQASSLAGMVDKLIRDRAGGDSNLAQLLNAMGVRVDAATGAVTMTNNSSRSGPSSPPPPAAAASSANAERSSFPSPSATSPEPRVQGRTGSSEEQSEGETRLSQSRGYHNTVPVLVDDSDDEEMLPQLIRRALVDPDRYYPHRPGGSAVTAMLIDDDDA